MNEPRYLRFMRLLVLSRRDTEPLIRPSESPPPVSSEKLVSPLDEGRRLEVTTLDEPLSRAVVFSTGIRRTVFLLRPGDGALLAVIDGMPTGADAREIRRVYQRAVESGRGMWVDFSDRPERFAYLP